MSRTNASLLLPLFALVACGSPSHRPNGPCTTTADCNPDEVCLGRRCTDVIPGADLALSDGATSDGATPDLAALVDMARLHDSKAGRNCFQALGDGGRDALVPGERCSLNGIDKCAAPISCDFESFDYSSTCAPIVDDGGMSDGGVRSYRCCQFAKTHNMIDGSVEMCSNCGDGWMCSPG